MHPAHHTRGARAQTLLRQLGQGSSGQRVELAGHLGHHPDLQPGLHRLLPAHALVGQPHAVSAEHTGQGVHQNSLHAQRVGHQAGMLAASAAKALQHVAGDVIAASHRDFLDGIGHLLHRDANEALGHLLGRLAGLLRQPGKAGLGGFKTQGLIGLRAKHLGEIRRHQFAQHHVGVGHGERPATPVAGRARVGASTLRPDPKARAVKRQDGAATRRHSVDAHHGRAHAHAGHLGLELALKLAGKVRHVGGSAAHVKANHPHCGIGRKRLARLG